MERIFNPEKLDQLFADHAVLQYTKAITFSHCVHIMSDVVFRICPSVGSWYASHGDKVAVTRQAVYDKLRHVELPTSAALVRYSAEHLEPSLRELKAQPRALLPGYRVRVLDGNHLAGTENRILESRRYRGALLPGQALVFYDPQYDLVTDVIPCEDAYTQERSLLSEAVERVRARDCIVADRNFCTIRFLLEIERRQAFFVIRQHAGTLSCCEFLGQRRRMGRDDRGRAIFEQAIRLTDPESGATLLLRRVTIQLQTPTSQGETEIHILTNLPAAAADAVQVADLYAQRWTIEIAFQRLTLDLQCEINTLGYPKAALFAFCVALVAYNVVSFVKGVVRAVWGKKFVEEQLSMYYLTLEVAQVSTGMMIAVGDKPWQVFRTMSRQQFATTMRHLAEQMDLRKYTKHRRGPKRKQPRKISGKVHTHISAARILAARLPS
jgi:Transposase DDE domain